MSVCNRIILNKDEIFYVLFASNFYMLSSKWSYKNNFNSEYISTQYAAPSHDGRIQLTCKVAAMLTLTFKLAKTETSQTDSK